MVAGAQLDVGWKPDIGREYLRRQKIIFVTQSYKMAKAKQELQALDLEQKILNRIYFIRGEK